MINMDSNGVGPDRRYWAAVESPKKLASGMRDRINRFRTNCDSSGWRAIWSQMLRLYYGLDPTGGFRSSHYVSLEGPIGSDIAYRINDIRTLARRQLVLATGTRPSFELTARAYDAETTETIEIGTAVLDRYLNDGIERKSQEAAEYMITMGEGWLATTWDDMAGKVQTTEPIVDPMSGDVLQPAMTLATGDVRVLALRPDQVIRDSDVLGGEDEMRWVILAVERNRWELAAMYPEYEGEILRARSEHNDWIWRGVSSGGTQVNYDTVTTYELYHVQSLTVPQGLQAIMVGDCVVSMGPLQYSRLPVSCALVSRAPESAFGYGESWDMMAPQIALDSVVSQLATTRENFGRSWIWVPKGAVFDAQNVSGSKVIESVEKPEVMDLSNGGVASGQTMVDMLRGSMGMMTGLDAQATKPTSGEMLALQQSQTAQYNSPLQFGFFAAYKRMLEQLLEIVQKFVTDEDVVHIVGKNNAPLVKRFKGSDLNDLDGVKIDMGTTAMRTASFRYQVAQNLLVAQVITPDQYLQMIATGRYQPALETPRVLETMAERRMQIVTDGGVYEPLATDPHQLLIARLATLLCDPEMEPRAPEIMPVIMKHVQLWTDMSMSPQGVAVLAATGQQPSPAVGLLQAMQPPAPVDPNAAPMPPDAGANPGQVQNMQNAPAAPNDGSLAGATTASLPDAAMAPSI